MAEILGRLGRTAADRSLCALISEQAPTMLPAPWPYAVVQCTQGMKAHHILMLDFEGPVGSNAEARRHVHDPWERVCIQAVKQGLALFELQLRKKDLACALL